MRRQGATIGNYVILKTIGYGGYGVVKLVRSMSDGKEYAMKVFELEDSEKERIHETTQVEFDKVAAINLPFIPKYYEFVRDATWSRKSGDDRVVSYLLMENC